MEQNNGKLAEALSKAQATIETPKIKNTVTFNNRSYKYADLAEVMDCIRGPLSSNGLALIHQIDNDEKRGVILKTSLIHVSGEMVESFYPLPDPSKVKAQDFGSALTYARRYSVSCLIGIASEEDDDGEIAPSPDPIKKSYPQSYPQGETTVSKLVENQYKPKFTPKPKPSDPEYFDDLDNVLGRSYQDPGPEMEPKKEKLKLLYNLVEDMQIPVDVIQVFIKQACGAQKKSDQMTEAEIDTVIQRIKLLN